MLATIVTYELVLLQFDETSQAEPDPCILKYPSDNASNNYLNRR